MSAEYRTAGLRGRCRGANAALVFATVLAGCADTVNPTAGGLQIGVQNTPLRPPVRLDSAQVFEFPPTAWSYGASGTTVLRILISETGSVDSAFVLESSGDAALDSAAMVNAHRLEWEPARRGGRPIPIWGRLPVIYPRPEVRSDAP